MSDSISEEMSAGMATANVPIVLAGTLDVENLATVNIDYEEAAYEAVNKLIEMVIRKSSLFRVHFKRY